MFKSYTGYCPKLGKEIEISIRYEKININGKLTPNYKKTENCCSHMDWAKCGKIGIDCPIFKQAR
jgi:hypothetical protein